MVEALGGGKYRIAGVVQPGSGAGQRQRLAYAVVDRGRTWVFIEGRTYVVDAAVPGGGTRARATEDQMAFAAPMPATVAAVNVTPGQEVREGDLLIMLEAMKMELPIKAPRDGRVRAIACREGELVQPGVALLELE